MNADALSRNPIIEENEDNPELPRREIFDLTDKQMLEELKSSEVAENKKENHPSEFLKILITRTGRKKYSKDIEETDSENEEESPPKSKQKTNDESIIVLPRRDDKLSYITKNTMKPDKIQATSTPVRINPTFKSPIQVPLPRKVGRPKKNFKPALKPLRKVGFETKVQKYSSVHSRAALS